jgi:hypothetical protein
MLARFSPRIRSVRSLRKLEWNAEVERFVNGRRQLETRVASGTFRIEFNSSDVLTATYRNDYEFVTAPFRVSGGPRLPIGVYEFNEGVLQFNAGAQRAVSGRFTLTAGEFYSGRRQQLEYNGRVKASSQLAFEPRILASHITLPEGAFTTKLLGARTTLHGDATHVRQRARAVQLEPQHARIEHPLAVGVSARKRPVHRLYGRSRHVWSALGGAHEPRPGDQGYASPSLLTSRRG